ncbi:MAG: hypothetical protein L6R38_006434 [Xanthoria sp. 2 TBL-2021]|nr:MAG: hypothetical protein L6R38_006434 [Xanthoria sp. 2 TBL-2021]
MAAAELDIPRLSAFCAVPQASLNSLLDTPTSDLVRNLLASLSPRIHEYDGLKAEKLKLNVELENAVRGGESKSRVLKNSIDKGVKEAAELRRKLHEEEQSKASVKAEFEEFKTSTASSTSEVTALKTRISLLESSNRDTLSILESKSTAHDKLAEELTVQHSKTLDLRQEVTSLEQRLQSADANVSTAKYHEQNLQQEIEHLKRNNDWLDHELKAKTDEYTKFRRDKVARISDLQRQNEESANDLDTARRTEQTLRNRIDELSQKLEEYLSRIQQLSDEATQAEESYRKNAESNKRLIELTRNSASTDQARLRELHNELDATKENAQAQLGKLASECQTESDGREAAEHKIEELNELVDKLQAELTELRTQLREDPPLHDGTNGQPSTPGRASSPASSFFSPGRSRLRERLNPTQLVAQNGELRTELAAAKQENERLKVSVDEMLASAESMKPEIEELRTEKAQLESNIAEMSSLVDHMGKERDQAVKSARKAAGQIEAKVKEGEVLRQQLRDLSTQTKILLFEMDRRDKGLDNFSADQQLQLEQLARGEADVAGMTDTDRFIAAELVMFRTTAELQEQNTKLLRITRELGERMEREEAARNDAEAGKDPNDYKQLYEQCQDEIRSLLTQSQSYIRERDMFRRMLTHRGQLPRDGDGEFVFGESVNGGVVPTTPSQSRMINSIEQSPHTQDMSDYAKLLKDMQTHFDNYRTEAATDHRTLKEQVDKLSNTSSDLRSEIAGSKSQLNSALERYQMLQSNYEMLRTENNELKNQKQFFSDNAAKQDLRTQQVAEDLVEAKGLLDSMRNENANLRAEKEFFEAIKKRLNADNEAHFAEKTRLNTLNVDLQNLLNRNQQTESEERHKLQSRVDSQELELQTTKRALSDQAEEYKRTSDRREFEHQQSQKRIDDLIASLSSTREEFAAAKTSRDHLQVRVDELTIELRSAEERIQLLQPAASYRLTNNSDDQTAQLNGDVQQDSAGREQELADEVSELKKDLVLAKNDLEIARGQVEQYKTISQSYEEDMQSLNETQELYRQDMDRVLEERNLKIQELEQRINEIHAELASTNSELTNLRAKEAEIDRQLQEQRSSFEADIARLKDQDDRHATAAKFHQEDLKAQAVIAQQAQQNYENELVKHAEAAKTVQKVRAENNELKIQMVELKTERDSARTNYAQSEDSWLDSKARYERELEDLREGKEGLADQNNRLHQQLETLGTQIANLQKRNAPDENDQPESTVTNPGLENLQEVIKYLRREKEIIDVQLELSTQETKRFKQQLDYTQTQLDETRVKLNQQRRVEENSERSSLNHNKLMDTINELNTFRESNVTLRHESRLAQASLAQKIREVEQLVAQVEPLQAEIRDLKAQQETLAGETKLLQEDRDFWVQRNQDILKKYDRVDPAELEALKTQLQGLQTERDELLSSKKTLQEQLDAQIAQAQEQTKERLDEMKSRLTDQFKTRSKTLTGTIRDRDAALQAITTEKQELEQRLEQLEQDLVKANADKDQALQDAAKATSNANAPTGSEDGQVEENEPAKVDQNSPADPAEIQTLQEKLAAAETRANEADSQKSKVENDVAAANVKVSELESRIQEIQRKLDAADTELEKFRTQASATETPAPPSASPDEIDKLRSDLEQAQQDAHDLRAAASIQASSTEPTAEEGGQSVAEQLSAMRASIQDELEARHNERVQKAEEVFERRTQIMKQQLTRKLNEGKEQVRADKEQALQALRTAHEKELDDLKHRHREELDELKRQEETRFADFKASAEQQPKEQKVETSDKAEIPEPNASWEPTDAEAKQFVATNATVRGILARNINQKVADAKTALASQLKEEHVKEMTARLVEAETKAKADKETAVTNEGRTHQLKLNLVESKGKLAQFRLDIVQRAANETPQKPVVEVWETAKGARPAISTGQQPLRSTNAQTPVRNGSVTQASPLQQRRTGSPRIGSPQTQAPLNTGSFGQPTPITTLQQPQQPQTQATQRPEASTSVAQASAPTQAPVQDNAANQNLGQPSTIPSQPVRGAPQPTKGPTNPDQQPSGSQTSSNLLPRQTQPQAQSNNHPNAGTGPATLRGLHHSGLPMPRGGTMNRGGVRGRGQPGRGRGGPSTVTTNPMQPPQQSAPSPTQLNAAAKQFVPQGSKRPREDSEGNQHGSDGKRIRGGAGGS